MKRAPWIFGCGIILFSRLLPASQIEPEWGRARAEDATNLAVPNVAVLRSEVESHGLSLIDRDLRIKLFEQIEVMMANHLHVYRQFRSAPVAECDAAGWAARKVGTRRIPVPDRTLIAAILVQIDILDSALAARDLHGAQVLRDARKLRSLRKKEDAVFGDRRDRFLFFCIDKFADIARLQSAIGGGRVEGWTAFSDARTPAQAEHTLVEGCTRLAERSRQLL